MRGFGYDDDDGGREWYDLQQVCLGGHIITNYAQSKPESRRARCSQCGEPTITACPACTTAIKGYHHVPGVYYLGAKVPERFCDGCGEAMPWVAREIAGIMDIVGLSDALSETEQETLRDAVKALVVPSGRTEVAALRLRKAAARMDALEQAALMRALSAVVTDAARTALGLDHAAAPAGRKR